jgi:hypothetical protein
MSLQLRLTLVLTGAATGLFSFVASREPRDWITEFGADGERYFYPRALNSPGFFEDFFNQKARAATTFWRVLNHRLAEASESV